jgi:signal transduction histidine kinase
MLSSKVIVMEEKEREEQSIGKELAKAKNVIDKFLYNCSHSMRGPLKSITGLVTLLKNQPADTIQLPQHLELIQKTVNKMETILSELEQFLANSRKELVIESVSMNEVLDTILVEHKKEAEDKNIRLSKNVVQTVPFYTDQERLVMVFSQLILNALVFNDSSKEDRYVDIFVRVNSNGCHIKVLDNGIGISADIQKNIFQLFYRGSQQSQGAGIGLYIVNEVLRKMSGSITVNSEEGCGSSFFVWIPNLKA